MNNMCITGYFVESTELTKEEKVKELELEHYHIEKYPDWEMDGTRVWTQEEYDALAEHAPWTLYIIRDC